MAVDHVRSARRSSYGTELFLLSDTEQRARWDFLLGPTFAGRGWQEGDQIMEVGSGLILQLRAPVGNQGWRWIGINANVYLMFSNATVIAKHRFVKNSGAFVAAQNAVAGDPCGGISMGSTTGVGIEPVYVLVGGCFYVEESAAVAAGAPIASSGNGRSATAAPGDSYMGYCIVGGLSVGVTVDLMKFAMPVEIPAGP